MYAHISVKIHDFYTTNKVGQPDGPSLFFKDGKLLFMMLSLWGFLKAFIFSSM